MKSGIRSPNDPPPCGAFIALGSNLGDSVSLLRQAMDRLQEFSDAPLLRSSLWQTSPVDCPPGSPVFVNAVVGLNPQAGETPDHLLHRLQELEREFGRLPKAVMNEPRPLDLDLIAFGDERHASDRLTLPHPRAHLRRFVLAPWAEIAPEFVIPGLSQTVAGCLTALKTDETIMRLPDVSPPRHSSSPRSFPPGSASGI